jgi:hypothetical protein
MKISGGHTINKIPMPRVAITTFSVQMATSGVANLVYQHGLKSALSIAMCIISSGMAVFGATFQRTNLEIMSLLTSNTHGGITTYMECSPMLAPR